MKDEHMPDYYASPDDSESITCIDAIAAMGQMEGFCKGNILKYLWRHGRKDTEASYMADLNKARHYLELYIEYIQSKEETSGNS